MTTTDLTRVGAHHQKPAYRVPSMLEIERLPWNGYTVASTFSGTGGSCLGYRMAGYRVAFASEFIPEAQVSYKLNHPRSILSTKDIRSLAPSELLDAVGCGVGELDLFDGSPPCASFSTAGKRDKGWGKVKAYSDSAQRTDDLFLEYARILKGVQPKVFVAENVKGLVMGTARGYFKEILQALKDCGYVVRCQVLSSMWLGVPQKRERTIFVGVRKDLCDAFGVGPVFPNPLPYYYTCGEALHDVVVSEEEEQELMLKRRTWSEKLWWGTKPGANFQEACEVMTGKANQFNSRKLSPDKPSSTIMTCSTIYHWAKPRSLSIAELKRIGGFPDDFQLTGNYAQQWERIGRAVPPVMMMHVAATVRDRILSRIS